MNCPDSTPESYRLPDGAKNKRKKSVRIAPFVEICSDSRSRMSETERFQGWWQQDEYEVTKSSARSMCRKMRRTGSTNSCLSDAYDQACLIASSHVNLDASISQADNILAPNEVRLNRDCQNVCVM